MCQTSRRRAWANQNPKSETNSNALNSKDQNKEHELYLLPVGSGFHLISAFETLVFLFLDLFRASYFGFLHSASRNTAS